MICHLKIIEKLAYNYRFMKEIRRTKERSCTDWTPQTYAECRTTLFAITSKNTKLKLFAHIGP